MNVLINLVEFQLKTEVICIRSLRMRIISAIMKFLFMPCYCHFKYCPMNVLINLVEFQLKQKLYALEVCACA